MHAHALYLYRLCVVLFIIEFQKFISVFLNNREKKIVFIMREPFTYTEKLCASFVNKRIKIKHVYIWKLCKNAVYSEASSIFKKLYVLFSLVTF